MLVITNENNDYNDNDINNKSNDRILTILRNHIYSLSPERSTAGKITSRFCKTRLLVKSCRLESLQTSLLPYDILCLVLRLSASNPCRFLQNVSLCCIAPRFITCKKTFIYVLLKKTTGNIIR